MKSLRTPDERFDNLPGYAFEPRYRDVPDGEDGRLRSGLLCRNSTT